MPYEWDHRRDLIRLHTDERISDGEVFEPTDREKDAFGDRLIKVEAENTTEEADESDPNPEGEADTDVSETPDDLTADDHWKAAVSDIESGEYDGRLDEVEGSDSRESVQNAVEERRAEL